MHGKPLRSKALASLGTVLVFAVAGPPFGAIVLSLVLPLSVVFTAMTGNPGAIGGRLLAVAGMAPPAALASYASGVLQAAATGGAVSLHALLRGFPAWLIIVIYATVAWAGYMVLGPSRDIAELALLWPVHVVPAVLCAKLTARFWELRS